MSIIVQKYGGSSVATAEKIKQVAKLIVERHREGIELVVVVSAMGDTTDELLQLAKDITEKPPRRELDMLVSCGERISMALLSMAISELATESISFTGSQSGIITTDNHFAAKIVEVRPHRILAELQKHKIVIVAGYQGMSLAKEVTTLGRGGSDTTAVALAAALMADACEIYSDIDGVYSADPRQIAEAKRLPTVSYHEMETFAGAGAKVLNADAVAFAKEAGITIIAKKTGDDSPGTRIEKPTSARKQLVCGVAVKAGALMVNAATPKTFAELMAIMAPFRARPEGLNSVAGQWSFCVDLENIPEHAALVRTLRQNAVPFGLCDVVSLVGESVAFDLDTVAKAIHLANNASRTFVESHRVSACVPLDEGKLLAQKWHAAFC